MTYLVHASKPRWLYGFATMAPQPEWREVECEQLATAQRYRATLGTVYADVDVVEIKQRSQSRIAA